MDAVTAQAHNLLPLESEPSKIDPERQSVWTARCACGWATKPFWTYGSRSAVRERLIQLYAEHLHQRCQLTLDLTP